MAGVVLETLSNKKLLILSFSLAIILTVFFLIGGIVAPSPNSVMDTLTVKCYDKDNGWHLNNMKPFTPRGKDSCKYIDSFNDEEIELKKIDANEIVFSQLLPLPKEGIDLDMSRWFQNLIAVMDVNVEYDEDNPYPENNKPEMLIEAKLFYRDKEDDESDWKLLAESSEQRTLDCTIEPERRRKGNLYTCELISLFELGSVHYDYYLINIRLPIDPRNTMNRIGKLADMHVIAIFQNGGFTKVWFSMKTVLFPMVLVVLVWFWRRVQTQGRSTNLTERTIFALGIILSIMNCPIEWLTLAVNMPYMMLLNDIRDGAFYAMLLSFWIIFVGEHMMDQVDRNRLMAYWKHLTVVILGCLALFIFEMCERGRQLVNPFFSIWSSEIGGAAAFGFIITAGIAACIYFLFLCYLVFRVFRNISLKRTSLLHMSTLRRKYYSGLIFRFKFLMIVTLLCAALTVIFFIIGQLSEGQWKWGDIDVSLEYTSAFLTGVYGMWNVYVIAILCLYAPSHKKFTTETDDTDTNSREEEVQLTQLPSEASTLTSFITKQSAD
ncbi:protein wntless-like isoform X1 [Biomphalaria glabrata]|uniref:Protein wntless-like isoform X1 n=3 Tax=Biomphalaria glabrata TaxID=6526 RepID=A0A9W3ACS0_BIOGL|nr:protein wntless-like isoform X1 [Biomphalaria glabrata]KAI8787195.1 protein wntless [Biomphalaria glabrata]